MNKSAATTLVKWGHWIVQVLAAKLANWHCYQINCCRVAWENSYFAKIPAFTTLYKLILVSRFNKNW